MSTNAMPAITLEQPPVTAPARPTAVARFAATLRTLGARRRIWQEGLSVLSEQALQSVTTLVTAVLLARAVGPEQYGAYVLGMSLVFFTEVLQRSCLAIPYTVFSQNRDPATRNTYLTHTLAQHVILSLAAAGVLLGLSVMLTPRTAWAAFLPAFALLVVGRNLAVMCRSVTLAHMRMRALLIAGLTSNGLVLLSLGLFYATGLLSVRLACYVLAAGAVLFSILALGARWTMLRFAPAQFTSDAAANWRYGRWILLSTLANAAGTNILPWLTLLWWDARIVATVGALTTIACLMRPAMQALLAYLTPKLARHIVAAGNTSARRATLALTALLAVAAVFYTATFAFFGNRLLDWFYAGKYGHAALPLTLFAAAIGLRAVNLPPRALLAAEHRPKMLSIASAVASAACLITALCLVPRWAATGVALAFLIHSAAALAIGLWATTFAIGPKTNEGPTA